MNAQFQTMQSKNIDVKAFHNLPKSIHSSTIRKMAKDDLNKVELK